MFRARKSSLIILAVVLLLLVAVYWARGGRELQGLTLAPAPAPTFTLDAPYRGAVSPATYRDDVVLLTFGRPSCAAACNPQLGTLRDALGRLGSRRQAVRVLYVTLEPDRMNEQQLLAFVQDHDLGFTGLLGDSAEIHRLARDLNEAVGTALDSLRAANPDDSVAAPASPRVYGIDRQGRLRVVWGPDDPAVMVRDIRALLRS